VSFAAAVVALAAMGQTPPATSAPPPADALQVEGDWLGYDTAAQVATMRGHALLRRGPLLVRADELVYDQVYQHVLAKGHVMLVQGLFAAVADELDADVQDPQRLEAGGKRMTGWQKQKVTADRLLQAKTQEELRGLGQSMLTMSGSHLRRVAEDEYEVNDLAFTPCDCTTSGEPSWHIEARHSDLESGERAILYWPVIYIGRIPVLPLPWLYLPMSDRRSGLLIPSPVFTGQNGFSLNLPVFVTLGRSYDLTLTPGYYFGRGLYTSASPEPGTNCSGDHCGSTFYGVKGPRLQTELNYAPNDKTLGRVTFGLIDDLRERRSPFEPCLTVGGPCQDPGGERGIRGEASIRHVQDLGDGYYDRVDVSFVSDGYYLRDLTADILGLTAQYLRSTAVLYHRDANSYVGLDATVRQDIRWGFNWLGSDVDAQGRHGPNTLDRLPGLSFALPDRPLAGPIWGGLQAQYTRIAPIVGLTGDEGPTGYYNPNALLPSALPPGTQPDPTASLAGVGDRVYEPGEREARERIDLNPHLMASLGAGNLVRLVPYVAYREDLYLGEITGQLSHRGYGLAGAEAETELSRVYDAGGGTALRHTITPNVELRAVPYTFGNVPRCGQPAVPGALAPSCAYDEIDSAIPGATLNPLLSPTLARSMVQAIADVRQTLAVRQAGATRQVLLLDVGQGFDVLHQQPADAFGRLVASQGAFSSTSILRYDVLAGRLAQLSSEVAIDDARGNGAYARFDRLLQGGGDRFRAGIDSLIGAPYVCSPQDNAQVTAANALSTVQFQCPSFAEQLSAGFRFKLPFGLAGHYDAIVQPLATPPSAAAGTPPPSGLDKVAYKFAQQVAAISYGPACDCWRVEAHAVFFPSTPVPNLGVSLTISRFGTFGN
jgi:LPS-assembly protein